MFPVTSTGVALEGSLPRQLGRGKRSFRGALILVHQLSPAREWQGRGGILRLLIGLGSSCPSCQSCSDVTFPDTWIPFTLLDVCGRCGAALR